MKALASVSVFALGISDAPVAMQQDGWQAFRAYTYADRGHRLMAQKKWHAAADAFNAAFARDPRNKSYLHMAQIARAALQPPRRAPPITPQAPPLLLAAEIKTIAQPLMIALAPAAGTAQQLAADNAGRFWGPVVRIAAPATEVAVLRERASPVQSMLPAPAALVLEQKPEADKRLSLQAGFSYRPTVSALASSEALLGRGGSWTSAALRLNSQNAQPLALTGFLYSAQSLQGFGVDSKSLQAGVSLRWQPHPAVSLEAGRLIKLGADSRNDWMLRAGAGIGTWRPADLTQATWLHWQARADAALIGLARRDIFAQADARLGLGVRLNDRVTLTPYVGSTATLQKETNTATLLEASPGLWLHLDGRVPIDARLEYRQKIAGNAASSDGIAVTLGFSF